MGTSRDEQANQSARTGAAAKQSRWAGTRQSDEGLEGVDWGHVDPATLVAVVYAVTRTGAMISFASTRSGKAVRVTVLDGSERPVWYANTPDELHETMRDILKRLSSF